ncbi:hypothetical protein [Micromonospora sp. NPDC047527]|uniref:hypothetical protein n=1 Tax=unclassified Micromonospora TaxID=2617518 RepID=UPI0033DF019D
MEVYRQDACVVGRPSDLDLRRGRVDGRAPPARRRPVPGPGDEPPGLGPIADTIGVAVPSAVTSRLALAREISESRTPLRLHLHDTRHAGVANAVAAVQAGVTALDAILVYLFNRMGQPTGLDLAELTSAVSWLEGRLGSQLPGALLRAGGFPA